MLRMLQRKLQTALDYARNVCILGSDNKIEDIQRTNNWTSLQRYRYFGPGKYMKFSDNKFSRKYDSPANARLNNETNKLFYDIKQWYYHINNLSSINAVTINISPYTKANPLADPMFKLQPAHKDMLEQAMFALVTRQGNCGFLCHLVAKYLWENSDGIDKIELITANTFDHVFIVINRSGNLKNPDTWGNAWIIDPWYKNGLIYPSKAFNKTFKQIKQYAIEQINECKKLGYAAQENDTKSREEIGRCICEINLARDRYPSYSENIKVEEYYFVKNIYPGNMYKYIGQYQKKHQKKFHPSLEEIKNPNITEKRQAFFQSKKTYHTCSEYKKSGTKQLLTVQG